MDHNPVHFYMQDARHDIDFPENSFDLIVCVSVLEHTDDYEKIVSTVHRLLRPEGAFVLTFDIATSPTETIGIQPAKAAGLLKLLSTRFSEPSKPSYGYSEQDIIGRIQGGAGQIMDVSWINENISEIAAPEEWKITISCHTFCKMS